MCHLFVIAHCFRVALPNDSDEKAQSSVLSSQLGRLSSWKQALLDRVAELAGWPVNMRSLEELAIFSGYKCFEVL